MALTLGRDGEDPEDDLRAGGLGRPVAGFLGAEASAGSFLGAGVGPWRADRDEVGPVGDLGGEVGQEVVEVSGGQWGENAAAWLTRAAMACLAWVKEIRSGSKPSVAAAWWIRVRIAW